MSYWHLHTFCALLALSRGVISIPAWHSLAGLSERELDLFMRTNTLTGAQPPPPAQTNTSSYLVNDAAHPYVANASANSRGPCPGLNTLANHGYLNFSGIVTPQDIVTAVQYGFNMEWDTAVFVTWGAFLVDGNMVTNLMSIGAKSSATGTDPPPPAIVGGLDTHGVFEGDASTTRGDYYFGDNHSFNNTLFNQAVTTCAGIDGVYDRACAAEVRYNRIEDSIARNPTFNFETPRYFTAYAESVFPYEFFVSGLTGTAGQLNVNDARGFFQYGQMPNNFYRRSGTFGGAALMTEMVALENVHPMSPGYNGGSVNDYTLNSSDPGFAGGTCFIYTKHVSQTIAGLYPPPLPDSPLKTALKTNLVTFYNAVSGSCTQLFPYGT